MKTIRVVLAEDNVLLSAGLELLLNSHGFEVAAVAADARSFLDAVDAHRPDLVIVDVRLPPSYSDEGIRAALELRRRYPKLPTMVLSQYVERQYAGELLRDGAESVGYLLKDRVGRVREFVDALHRVVAGGAVVDPEVVSQLLGPRAQGALGRLTVRETEVLVAMAEGRSNTEIAERLTITENAVHKHVGNIFTKLDLPPTEVGHRRVRAVLEYLRVR